MVVRSRRCKIILCFQCPHVHSRSKMLEFNCSFEKMGGASCETLFLQWPPPPFFDPFLISGPKVKESRGNDCCWLFRLKKLLKSNIVSCNNCWNLRRFSNECRSILNWLFHLCFTIIRFEINQTHRRSILAKCVRLKFYGALDSAKRVGSYKNVLKWRLWRCEQKSTES